MPELMDKNLSSPPDFNQMQFDNYRDEKPSEPAVVVVQRRRRSLIPWLLILLLLSGAALVAYELHTAHYQSKEISLYTVKKLRVAYLLAIAVTKSYFHFLIRNVFIIIRLMCLQWCVTACCLLRTA